MTTSWPDLFTGTAIGAVITWMGGLAKTGFEHFLAERKERRQEERVIRAEQREEARKQAARKQDEHEQLKKNEAILGMHKTQLRGTSDLPTAANVVTSIHGFLWQWPQHINAANRAFLEKYPADFRDQVFANKYGLGETTLAELKRDVETLHFGSDLKSPSAHGAVGPS